MANILEKAISILAGNLNSGRSYLIAAVWTLRVLKSIDGQPIWLYSWRSVKLTPFFVCFAHKWWAQFIWHTIATLYLGYFNHHENQQTNSFFSTFHSKLQQSEIFKRLAKKQELWNLIINNQYQFDICTNQCRFNHARSQKTFRIYLRVCTVWGDTT